MDDFAAFKQAVYDHIIEKYPKCDVNRNVAQDILTVEIFYPDEKESYWICGIEVRPDNLWIFSAGPNGLSTITKLDYCNPRSFSLERVDQIIRTFWQAKCQDLHSGENAS